MKAIAAIVLLLLATPAWCQTQPKTASQPKSTTQTKPTAPAASQDAGPVLSAKARELCREWKLSKTENFGNQHDPTAEQKGDKLVLNTDGSYTLVMNGVSESGTWTLDKSNIWLTLKTEAGATKKLKILESTATTLKVDYRDEIDIHNILYYTSGTSGVK
jgi:hypothetical protein